MSKKILSLWESNYLIKKETEKAYLLASNDIVNKDTWFPKAFFIPAQRYNGETIHPYHREDGALVIPLQLKNWFWRKLSPDQEAILSHCKPVH